MTFFNIGAITPLGAAPAGFARLETRFPNESKSDKTNILDAWPLSAKMRAQYEMSYITEIYFCALWTLDDQCRLCIAEVPVSLGDSLGHKL